MQQHCLGLALALGTTLAQAHAGHGLPGTSHWHLEDVALVLAAVAALGFWLARRK